MSEIIPLPAGGTIRIMTDRVPPPITEITPLPANGTIRIAWIPEPSGGLYRGRPIGQATGIVRC